MKPHPRTPHSAPASLCLALSAAAAFALSVPLPSAAQEASFSSPLSSLANPREGRAMHEGSGDRKHQNDDALHVKAGETVTLFTHEGPGCVHRFWVTIAPRED